jgi:hypothetical protein
MADMRCAVGIGNSRGDVEFFSFGHETHSFA